MRCCGSGVDVEFPATVINRLPRYRIEGALIASALPGDPKESPVDQLLSCPEQLVIRRPTPLSHDAERGTKITIVGASILDRDIDQEFGRLGAESLEILMAKQAIRQAEEWLAGPSSLGSAVSLVTPGHPFAVPSEISANSAS